MRDLLDRSGGFRVGFHLAGRLGIGERRRRIRLAARVELRELQVDGLAGRIIDAEVRPGILEVNRHQGL